MTANLAEQVREAVAELHGHKGQLKAHKHLPWASSTFSGTKHGLVLVFDGAEAVEAGEALIANLPDHEFNIPGQVVADASIMMFEHDFMGSGEQLRVTVVLLLLEERK